MGRTVPSRVDIDVRRQEDTQEFSGVKKIMIKEAIVKLGKGEDLSKKEIELVMEEIMTGQALPTQIAAFLTAMRIKVETPDEIAGAAGIMRRHAVKIKTRHPVVLDTCGTGGDERNTFNVSTVAAFVAAGGGGGGAQAREQGAFLQIQN